MADLTVIPDDEIKTHRKVAWLEYVQKHLRVRDLSLRQQDIIFLLKLTQPTKEQRVCLLHYLAQEANALDMKAFFNNLAENDTDCTEEMMTFAEQLKQEGRQEGRAIIVRNLLSLGMDRATIARVTELNDAELDALMEVEA